MSSLEKGFQPWDFLSDSGMAVRSASFSIAEGKSNGVKLDRVDLPGGANNVPVNIIWMLCRDFVLIIADILTSANQVMQMDTLKAAMKQGEVSTRVDRSAKTTEPLSNQQMVAKLISLCRLR
jgi:hypothetical protein